MEKDTLKDDLEDFALCVDHESEQRKQSESELEFVLRDKQWSDDDVSERDAAGRPHLTINRLKSFGKQVVNDAKINRASIAVKPVGGGADKATADIQSDLIRNIETQSQAPGVYDTAFQFAVYGGLGYFRVNVDYTDEDAWDQDIFLQRIANPFSVYGDYESTEATSIDWNRCYVTDVYSKKAFEAKWGKDKKAGSFEVGSGDYDKNWFTKGGIRVAEVWRREEVPVKLLKLSNGAIMFEREYLKNKEQLFDPQEIFVEGDRDTKTHKVGQRLITGTDILETNEWLGKYIPVIPMYGEEVNIAGKRYFNSLIHSAIDSQRLYNYQRTLAAELGGLQPKAPWLGPVGMFVTDAQKWQSANRVAHPYLEYDVVADQPGATPTRIPFAGPPAGAMQDALMASDDMKAIIGIYDASLGARSNETSGRAIMARQREGDTSTFDFVNNRNVAVEHGGRIILDLIPKLYTAERILRCVQEDGSTYTVPVNQPVAPRRDLEKLMQAGIPQMPGMPPQATGAPMQPGMAQTGAQPEQDEEQQGPPEYVPIPPEAEGRIPPEQLRAITKMFDLTAGKYDVMVTAGPGFNTRREEAATQMMEFIRVFPQSAPLIGDLLAKNLDWPGAEQVAERLKAMLPPQAAGKINPMVQQLQGMLQQQDAQAKEAVATLQKQIADLMAQVKDKQAEQALKSQENTIKMEEAKTRRMEVLKPEAQQAPTPPDPFKAQELELAEREAAVKDYEAITERLKVLAAALPPEAFAMLVMKTTGEAMHNGPIDGGMPGMMPGCDMPGMEMMGGPPEAMPMMQEPMMDEGSEMQGPQPMAGGAMQPPMMPPPVDAPPAGMM